jgi:imidazoleglycerol phosphate dehydratase HisB
VIALVDYGAGNLTSVRKAFAALGAEIETPSNANGLVHARAIVHLKVLYGRSNHHKIEACFKAFARALRVACARDRRLAKMLPSTKGVL